MIAHRVDDLYAHTAKGEGEITDVRDNSLTITYDDGSSEKVAIGRDYGVASDLVIPHDVLANVEKGQRVSEGHVVSYNKGFFRVDPMDPSQVLASQGVMAKVTLMERSHTFEDASVISQKLAQKIATPKAKKRTIYVHFDQTVKNLVKAGDAVDIETILCTIEDPVTADNDLFDDDTLDTLKLMGSRTPMAKFAGVVDRLEVFYHGDKDDMGESLRAIADASDKRLKKRRKEQGKKEVTGEVDGTIRIDKNALDLDTAAIQVIMSGSLGAGVGDKGVFGHQLKTVFSHVMTGENRTQSGEDIDAMFGYMSVSNRVVISPEVMGTTNTLLRKISKKVAETYFSNK